MQLTLHAIRRTLHGSRRFALSASKSAWSVKTDVLRPGIVGIRGSMVYDWWVAWQLPGTLSIQQSI